MSTDQNKMLARQFVEELLNRGNMSMIDELFAPDFVEHETLPPEVPPSREAPRIFFTMLRSAFPDLKATIEHLIAEDDKVVLHMIWTGTQKDEFMGVPPTGKSISVGVIDIIRIADGQFVEHWGVMDNLALMQQLGAVPGP